MGRLEHHRQKTIQSIYSSNYTRFYANKNALDNHYIEGNPFLGKYPSSDRILLQKFLSAGVVYWSFNKLDAERRRKGLLIVNGIQWGVVINNENIGATFKYNW